MNEKITRLEANAIRGLAILAISLHNYTHWLKPMVKENEYTFSQHNVDRLIVEMLHPTWDIAAHLLSFFGHYGVQAFVFLSAFGLVMKYESPASPATAKREGGWTFMKRHYMKLWMMMITGYVFFVMIDYMTPHPYYYKWWNIVGQLGMFSNLYDDPDHAIWPGPYWYFGLMVQLYALYRFVLYRGSGSISGHLSHRNGNILLAALAIGSVVIEWMMEPEGDSLNWYRYNVMGAILPFAAGLTYARWHQQRSFSRPQMAVAFIISTLFILFGSFGFLAWTFIPLAVCVAFVTFVKILPKGVLSRLAWVGGISAAMFVSHPIARKIIIPISHRGDIYAGLLLYFAASIVLAILFKALIEKVKQ